MQLAKVYLIGFGLFTLAFGLAYLFVPLAMTEPAGFESLSASATTDVRATYGGFQIGLGAYLLWSAQSEARWHGALLLTVLSIGAVLTSRVFGLLVDGDLSGFHASGLVVELVLTASAVFVLRKATSSAEDHRA